MTKRSIKFISLFLIMMLMVISFVACSPDGEDSPQDDGNVVEDGNGGDERDTTTYPLELEDSFGNRVVFEGAPKRIVSTIPSHTEILFGLGLEDEIVGVSAFCDYPEEALEKTKIGDYEGTDLEKIIELEPDLVLLYGPGDEEENARLEEAGIPLLGYLPESVDEVIETIETIGEITDTNEAAKSITDDMISKRDEIVGKVEGEDTPRVFYEIWHDPLSAAGPGSFMDELINLSGGENIAKDAEQSYAEYDLESLIEKDPEIYLAADDSQKTIESISERPGYGDIRAIKEGNIYLLDDNIASRPGPRIIEALELVAKTIHPDLFD